MLTREQKSQQIAELTQNLANSASVVLVNYSGLKLADLEALRKKCKELGVVLKIVKNSLLNRAFEKHNISLSDEMLSQPLAVAFSLKDDISGPKTTVDFAKNNDALEIVGGIYEKIFVDGASIKAIAMLPSKNELYVKVVGSISAPISRLLGALNWNSRAIVTILQQRLNKISN